MNYVEQEVFQSVTDTQSLCDRRTNGKKVRVQPCTITNNKLLTIII